MSSITPSDKELERVRIATELIRLPDGKNLGMKWDMEVLLDYIQALIATSNAKAVKAELERLYQQGDDFDVAIPAAIRVQDTIIKEASHE